MAYPSNGDSVAHDQIRAFVERIERLDEELKAINDDKKEIFAEAKGNGFDTKALKIVIRKRSQDVSKRMEIEALVELYEVALGMRAEPGDDEEEPRAGARASAREIIEEFDAETGEILDTQSTAALKEVPGTLPVIETHPRTSAQGDGYLHKDSERPLDTDEGSLQSHVAGAPAGTQARPVDTQSATTAAAIDGEDIAPVLSVDPIPTNVIAIKPKPFRPFCQHREACHTMGPGNKHCHGCEPFVVAAGGEPIQHSGSVA